MQLRCCGNLSCRGEKPCSPESLATRDFYASHDVPRLADQEASYDDRQLSEVELELQERVSLTYEEARALLGRLEFQKGNYDAALQILQAIDIKKLTPRMVKAIVKNSGAKKALKKGGSLPENGLSVPSLHLLLEALLLKVRSLEKLGRLADAATECRTIIDIFGYAWPRGIPEDVTVDARLMEVLHYSLEYLPKLWEQAGHLDRAVLALRNALMKAWKLDSKRTARLQKALAVSLLYCGVEFSLQELTHPCVSSIPESNMEEAILLLMILMEKMETREISWDPDILNHLMHALPLCRHSRVLATHVEMTPPGSADREEGWFALALSYSAAGMDEDAINILLNGFRLSKLSSSTHILSLILGAKLCCGNLAQAPEGIKFVRKAMGHMTAGDKHFASLAIHYFGVCCGNMARSCVLNSEKFRLQNEALSLLREASKEDCERDALFSLAWEYAMQRKLGAAVQNVVKFINMTHESSISAWKLLILVLSALQNFEDAEAVVNLAMDQVQNEEKISLLIIRADIWSAQGNFKGAIESLATSLAIIHRRKEAAKAYHHNKPIALQYLEIEAWLNMSCLYIKLERWGDAKVCIEKAKCINFHYPRCWHVAGLLLQAQNLHEEAVVAFSISLCIDPEHVPSMVSMAAVLRALGGKSLHLARTLLLDALRCDPMDHEGWLLMGFILKSEGSLCAAADCFRNAYVLNQTSPVRNFAEAIQRR